MAEVVMESRKREALTPTSECGRFPQSALQRGTLGESDFDRRGNLCGYNDVEGLSRDRDLPVARHCLHCELHLHAHPGTRFKHFLVGSDLGTLSGDQQENCEDVDHLENHWAEQPGGNSARWGQGGGPGHVSPTSLTCWEAPSRLFKLFEPQFSSL